MLAALVVLMIGNGGGEPLDTAFEQHVRNRRRLRRTSSALRSRSASLHRLPRSRGLPAQFQL